MSGYGSCPMAGTVLFWGLRFAIECPEEKETTLDTIKETSLVKKVDKGSYPTTQGSLSGLVWAHGEWRENKPLKLITTSSCCSSRVYHTCGLQVPSRVIKIKWFPGR